VPNRNRVSIVAPRPSANGVLASFAPMHSARSRVPRSVETVATCPLPSVLEPRGRPHLGDEQWLVPRTVEQR
jgi:hypothetical protein